MNSSYKDIDYNLRRSDRKTASIYIERDGRISVLAPRAWTDIQIERVLERKRPWIYRGLAEWEDLNTARVTREFVNGEGFLYFGSTYRLHLIEKQKDPIVFKNGYFQMRSDVASSAYDAFKEFYREKGLTKIRARVRYYQAKMGVTPSAVKVLDLKNRWASCSPNGNLNFHWKCAMAPIKILDYIAVHELGHIKYKRHTEAFWNCVDKVMPDFRERKDWLRRNGAGMDL